MVGRGLRSIRCDALALNGRTALQLLGCGLLLASLVPPASAHDSEWDAEGVKYITERRRLSEERIEQRKEVEEQLDRYMHQGMGDVIGWFDFQALLVLRLVAAHQLSIGIEGGIVEIGVHHGKSFVALALLNQDGGEKKFKSVAVDVFDDQLLNSDGSGEGDLDIFMATLKMWCGLQCTASQQLSVLSQDSRLLTPEQVVSESNGQRPRLFSIDGSHTAEATYADLNTAAGSIARGGIVIVDDFFAEGWPGVSEGVYRFFHEQEQRPQQDTASARLVPFFVGFNKVLLAEDEYASGYQDVILERRSVIGDDSMRQKMTLMLNHPVLVFTEEVRCRKNVRSL